MTNKPVSDLSQALATMNPILKEGTYVFATLEGEQDIPAHVIATFKEDEGMSVILEEGYARALNIDFSYQAAWISLIVNTDLALVGFTAALSRALADEGVSCNVVAANHHDHLFVEKSRAKDALNIIKKMQSNAAQKQ